MDVAAFVVSLVAVAAAGGSLWYARGQKLAAERSADEAKRSADAAAEAVGYQRAEAERNRVVFRLYAASGSGYVLTNEGAESAYGVHVDTGDIRVHGQEDTFDVFGPDHSEGFLLSKGLGTQTTHITVTWHFAADCSDTEQSTRLLVT